MRKGGNGSVQSGPACARKLPAPMKTATTATLAPEKIQESAFLFRMGSDLRVGRGLKDDVGDGRDVVAILRIGGKSLPLGVLAKLAPRGVPRRHVGESEHVHEARRVWPDDSLAE